ncbi:hypothetical protein C8R43DRAFT_946777 [Mycena crocata]|nr:hypothetical protein C8R43DRAFT_946777 [Mycena crocata]
MNPDRSRKPRGYMAEERKHPDGESQKRDRSFQRTERSLGNVERVRTKNVRKIRSFRKADRREVSIQGPEFLWKEGNKDHRDHPSRIGRPKVGTGHMVKRNPDDRSRGKTPEETGKTTLNPEREAEDGRGSKRRRDRIGRWEYGPEGQKRTSGRPEDWTELRNEVAEK